MTPQKVMAFDFHKNWPTDSWDSKFSYKHITFGHSLVKKALKVSLKLGPTKECLLDAHSASHFHNNENCMDVY